MIRYAEVTAKISAVLIAVLITILVYIVGSLIWPYDPIAIKDISINKTQVEVGDEICYTVNGCKKMALPADVTISLMNGEVFPIMHYRTNMPTGKLIRNRCFNIPSHIKPGKYRIYWTAEYQVNAFRKVVKNYNTNVFEVVE
jgi:hypothetical protein